MTATERVQTTLRFTGDWPGWLGVSAAVVLAAAAWLLYHRDVRLLAKPLRFGLPALRAAAVAMLVLMLSGPILHHRKTIGQLTRLLVFIDGSRSMEFTDAAMDAGRKIRILQRLGLLRGDAAPMDLPRAGEALSEAESIAEKVTTSQTAESSEWNRLLTDFAAKINEARDAIAKAGELAGRAAEFGKELAEPAHELAGREMRQIDDRKRATADLGKLAQSAARWRGELAKAFDAKVSAMAGSGDSALQNAIGRFDAMPRWQRLQSLLLEGEGDRKLLEQLAEKHDVQLLTLRGGTAERVWQPTARNSALPTALPHPDGEVSDLATGIRSAFADDRESGEHGAVVLLSDGQHNEGEPPVEVAKILGARQMPVFTVGFGSAAKPRDLAILKVAGPESVFAEDRVRGQITLKDDMPAGQPFTVSIRGDGDAVLWEQKLFTDGKNVRTVAYDFPVNTLVAERLKSARPGVQVSSVPLEVKVRISQAEGERELGNNESTLRVRAVTQRRKILLLDGRPRWEVRYLRNLFERDEQWELNAVVAGATKHEAGFVRGDQPEQFPSDPALLQSYDLIIFGEVPRALLRNEELVALRDFVAQRGGAIAFIDGPRGVLKEYTDTPLATLFPVSWTSPDRRENIQKLELSETAQTLAPFALAPERESNNALWSTLPVPHWLAGVQALPGAETLLHAVVGGQKIPAVVARPFGAGRVLYHAFEDSWRWRYEVGDQHHVKYWNQVANWIAEIPFAVRDKLVSLDAGAITYRPGESADLRVRLRDGQGRPVTNTVVDAVLSRDGKRVASIRLAADENAGGLFRGRTAALEPGSYEVAVESAAIAAPDARARAEFKVEPRTTGELTQLNLNEELLRQMATASGGQYLREENLPRLLDLLAPLSQGQVIESDTILWQSWWWFIPIILLLTLEWALRKRAGML